MNQKQINDSYINVLIILYDYGDMNIKLYI